MGTFTNTISTGGAVKTSLPLAERTLGVGFGFSGIRGSRTNTDDKDLIIELSLNAKKKSEKLATAGDKLTALSASPLNQALDAIAKIADRIDELQKQYAYSPLASREANSIATELGSLTKEFKRITEGSLFRRPGSDPKTPIDSQYLSENDSFIRRLYGGGDVASISFFEQGMVGLANFDFAEILTDTSIRTRLDGFIKDIRSVLIPEEQKVAISKRSAEVGEITLISSPQAQLQNYGNGGNLSVSLLSYSSGDLIKAAAAHADFDATNVLLLTTNPSDEDAADKRTEEKSDDYFVAESPITSVVEAAPADQQKPI